jgi:hypothetical protein
LIALHRLDHRTDAVADRRRRARQPFRRFRERDVSPHRRRQRLDGELRSVRLVVVGVAVLVAADDRRAGTVVAQVVVAARGEQGCRPRDDERNGDADERGKAQ